MKKLLTFCLILLSLFLIFGCSKKEKTVNDIVDENNDSIAEEKINIVDLNSKSRPYAVIINNAPVAVKVQTGLNDAYLIYEFPVEGGLSRSLALFKDKTTEKVGTVRSARHNFLDYVLENDAIFVHYGWSIYAEKQIPELNINNINGLSDSPFWRENPEGLATEHTAYTSLVKDKTFAEKKEYKQETDVKVPLNYSADEIDLSSDGKKANTVSIPYSNSYGVKFTYDSENKVYNRFVNNNQHIDYFTKEKYTAKNIIVLKIDYEMAENNYYLNLKNVGTGKGYYITDGYAREITWEKKDRSSQTTYKYSDGTDVKVNDGNTYVMLQLNTKNLGIE